MTILKHPHDREILRLAVPAFGALVAEPLFLLADSAIVGRLGTTAQAGLGIAGQALTTIVGICIFLAYGTTAAVARQMGAGHVKDAVRQGIDGIWLALALAGGLILICLPLVPWIVDAFGTTATVAPAAGTYLRISLFGIPGMLVVLAGTGVLRGMQDTRTPLYVSVGSFTLNLALNWLFVLGFGWGIAGSAWGTVIAQTIGGAVYIGAVLRSARRHDSSLWPDAQGVRAAATAGVAMVVRTVTLQAVLVTATAVAAHQGTSQLAAYGVGSRIWLFLALALDAIAIAGQAITGRYLGASDIRAVRGATRRMTVWGAGAGVVFGLVILTARPWLPALFTHDPAVRNLLLSSLILIAAMQPIAGVVFVLDGVLIGAGDMRYLALAGTVTMVVFLPAAWLVYAMGGGLVELWLTITLWITARLITLGVRARGGTWMVTGAVRG
jgi:putative MATE family efflux protein